jgi:hypothetical protein
MISYIDSHFPCGPIDVCCGGENGAYTTQPNLGIGELRMRYEILETLPCMRYSEDVLADS